MKNALCLLALLAMIAGVFPGTAVAARNVRAVKIPTNHERIPQKPSLGELRKRIVRDAENREDLYGKGTRLEDLRSDGDGVRIVFSEQFRESAWNPRIVDDVVQRLSVLAEGYSGVRIEIRTEDGVRPLDDFVKLPGRADVFSAGRSERAHPVVRNSVGGGRFPLNGALSGKTIIISPGHGWYYSSNTEEWHTQRGLVNGIIEDFTNWRMAGHVIQALEHAGARVISCRERDIATAEVIVDNDAGSPDYTDGSGWSTSTYVGFNEGSYRTSPTTSTEPMATSAFWSVDLPAPGAYAVYVAFRAGENRVTDARYTVHHGANASTVLVDQTGDDRRWVYIGSYVFSADGAHNEGVELSNFSVESGYVVADTVKIGGGMGSLERNGSSSGKPRWQEAARYWVEFSGAPGEVYHETWTEENSADVTTRPLYADWRGGDLYLSLHSNAAGSGNVGYGTETFMYDGVPVAGSERWRDLVNAEIVGAIRSEWDANWTNRGLKTANFGELRELLTMPGCLTEIGFHDTEYDAFFLKRPPFRATVARAVAKAALDYFESSLPLFPLPVKNIALEALDVGTVRLSWNPQDDATYPNSDPTGYRIYISEGGTGFDNGTLRTTENHYDFDNLSPGMLYAFRVSATNVGGESLWSEPVVARINGWDKPNILIVNGFDRLDASIQEEENNREYALLHAKSIQAAGDYYFLSTSNEAFASGSMSLYPYEMLDWIAGEEAKLTDELDAYRSLSVEERQQIQTFVNQGGNLFISGSEIGWDVAVSADGEAQYLAFLNDTLRAGYVSDDADEYGMKGVDGGIFQGITGTFDDGSHGVYDVDWPDVLAPEQGSTTCMTYSDVSKGLGVCYDGDYRLVYLGIPFESIVGNNRDKVMLSVLNYLAAEQIPVGTDGDRDEDVENIEGVEDVEDGDDDADFDFSEEDADGNEVPDGDLEADAGENPEGDTEVVDGDEEFGEEISEEDADFADAEEDNPSEMSEFDNGLECLPGYERVGGACIKSDDGEGDGGGGGCRQSRGGFPPAMAVFLMFLTAFLVRRRRTGFD